MGVSLNKGKAASKDIPVEETRMKHRILLAFFTLTLSISANAGQALSKEEVINLFSGRTVRYTVVPKNLDVVAYFDPDGEARELRGGKPDTHPWWVKDNGAHCIQFKGKKPSCKKVMKRPDGTYVKYRKGKLLVEYHSFTEGNPENL
ncbi:MAG: hypothetical protein D6772_07855 [Bacteroidetes bacterium]|nr:MAG: hypothetical protein D6772_07855 [Bacteroidota bacterium]